MTGPNFENLPLVMIPFYSRLSLDASKYQLIAFKPGYPLQHSELNEMQEMFYVQQSLTAIMWSNWCTYKVASTINSKGPGWEGATPLQPSLLQFSNNILTVSPGWYLCALKTSGFYIWLYNHNPEAKFTFQSIPTNSYVGFSVSTQGVDASGNVVGVGGFVTCREDQSLREYYNDQIAGECGADRYKVELTSVGRSGTGYSDIFLPIVQRRDNFLYFMNNTIVGTV